MQDLDLKRKHIETAIKVLVAGVVSFVVAPVIFLTIQGMIGLIIAGGIGFTAIKFAPWFGMKVANWRLKAIKHEASKNPIETLQNQLREETVKLDDRKANIEKLNGQIRTFSDKVDDIKAQYGANDAGYLKLSRDVVDLRRVYAHRCEKWRIARAELDKFSEQIERGRMIWEAAQAAAAARETSGLTEDEFFARLKTETAFDSIQQNYNAALASLDTAMLEAPEPQPARVAAGQSELASLQALGDFKQPTPNRLPQ